MNLFDLAAKLTLDKSQYESGIKSAKADAETGGSKISKALKTAAKVGAAAIGAASAAIVGFGKQSVAVGMDFDKSMAQVAATMGKTVDEVSNLRDFAQEMGAKTAFSATQAADALNYMALAGYDAETSMTMLPNVLNLAAAGGMELATASDMVTDAQSALGLTLDQTSAMVDQMAMASSKSNTSVSQLGEAILTIGATARNVKGGTQELTTVLGVLADNGIKGAEGGTHLRNMLLALQNPTTDGAAALKDLGVKVYDADGNMRSMVDIVGDLQKGLDGMDQSAKDSALSTIFNKTDLASANALIGTSIDRFGELTSAIEDSKGAADKMAGTQLDNLAGDITLFKSALEGAQIAVSDGLTPTLRDFVQFGTDGLGRITDAFKQGGFVAAIETAGDVLGDAVVKIVDYAPKIVEAAVRLVSAFVRGITDNIDGVIDSAFEIIDTIVNTLSDPTGLITLIDAAFQVISKLAEGLVENLPKLLPAIVGIVIDIADKLTSPENLTSLLDAAIAILLALADGLIASIDMLLDKAPELIDNLVYALIVAAPKLIEAAAEIILKLSRYLSDPNLLIDLVKAALQIVVSVGEGIIQAIPELIGVVFQMVGALAEYIVGRGTDIVNAAKRLMNFFTDGVSQKIDDIKQWGRNIIDGFVGGILEKWDALKKKISGIVDSVKNIFTGKKGFDTHSPSKWAKEVFANVLEGGEAGIASELPNALKTAGEAVDAIQDEMIPTSANLADGIVTEELSVDDGRGNASAQILSLLNYYLPTLASMKIMLDSGALVGELAPGMDAALGRRASYAARGMA